MRRWFGLFRRATNVLSSDQCKVIGFVSSKLNFNNLYSNKCMTFC